MGRSQSLQNPRHNYSSLPRQGKALLPQGCTSLQQSKTSLQQGVGSSWQGPASIHRSQPLMQQGQTILHQSQTYIQQDRQLLHQGPVIPAGPLFLPASFLGSCQEETSGWQHHWSGQGRGPQGEHFPPTETASKQGPTSSNNGPGSLFNGAVHITQGPSSLQEKPYSLQDGPHSLQEGLTTIYRGLHSLKHGVNSLKRPKYPHCGASGQSTAKNSFSQLGPSSLQHGGPFLARRLPSSLQPSPLPSPCLQPSRPVKRSLSSVSHKQRTR